MLEIRGRNFQQCDGMLRRSFLKLGALGIFEDAADKAPIAMRPPDNANTGFGVTLARLPADNQREGRVAALDGRGQILDPKLQWRFDPAQSRSKSRNTPFAGWELTGQVVAAMVGGNFVYRAA